MAGIITGMNPLPPAVHHTTTRLTHRDAHEFLSSFLEKAENYAAYRPDSILTDRGPVASTGGTVTSDATSGEAAAGQSNLTLLHLRRIMLGMEGKRVGGVNFEGGLFGKRRSNHKPNENNDLKRKRNDQFDTDRRNGQREQRKRKIETHQEVNDGVEWSERDGVVHGDQLDGQFDRDDRIIEVDEFDPASGLGQIGDFSLETDRHPGADLDQPQNAREERELVEIELESSGKKVDPRKQKGQTTADRKYATNAVIDEVGGSELVDKEERKRLKKLRLKEERQAKYKDREEKNK